MCLTPASIVREVAGRKMVQHVPCGVCNECVKDKQNEYMIRSLEEAKKLGSVWFFTLTYNEDNVPVKFDLDGEVVDEDMFTGEVRFADSAKIRSLNRKDITVWKKRVRERLNKRLKKEGKPRIKFSFLICGEYGPKTHRPHYHGLFFGIDKGTMLEFKKDWEEHYGFTVFKYIPSIPVNGSSDVERTARYVSKYICKLKELEDEMVLQDKVEKPRKMVSFGYGLPSEKIWKSMVQYHQVRDLYPDYDIDRMFDLEPEQSDRIVREVIKRRRYTNGGYSYKLPNFYKRKLFYIKDELFKKIKASGLQRLVSSALEMDVRKDYSRKFASLASDFPDAVSAEEYFKTAVLVRKSEENRRQEMSQIILENNKRCLRKSVF